VFPSLTVADNLGVARRAGRASDAGAGADAPVAATDVVLFPRLRDRFDVPAGQLSGGEQQMLALAMGIAAGPLVLLVDQLSLGLAPTVVDEVVDVLRSLTEAGTSVVLVEQSLEVAAQVAHQALLLERGVVAFRGPPADLRRRPDLVRGVFLGAATEPAGGQPEVGPVTAVGRLATRADAVPAALAVEDLCCRYGGLLAVDGVSFAVAPGEIVGLVGPNGAGKTTVLDLVRGFLPVAAGRVRLEGRDVTGEPPAVRAAAGLGRVAESGGLFPDLTVGETVAVALSRQARVRDPLLAVCGTAAARWSEEDLTIRAWEVLGAVGLSRASHQLVRELSTGTRRLLEVACAVATGPRVLLLDEPTAGLSRAEGEALVGRLLDLREQTGAVLAVVEHDLDLLARLADRLVGLELGRVVAQRSPRQVLGVRTAGGRQLPMSGTRRLPCSSGTGAGRLR
jgi:ABC-type branched-subunit amino acid transport system ATPase component